MNISLLNKHKHFISDHLNRKTVMVSGASGLIGSSIVRLLDEINKEYGKEIKIIALYRDLQKLSKVVNLGHKMIVPIRWNSELEEFNCEEDADYVIHCAGVSGGSKMKLHEPVRLLNINIDSTEKLLDYCVKKGSALLFASSYEVYGLLSQNNPFDENAPSFIDTFTVRNVYAECKRLCEMLCCAYSAQYGIKTSAVRLTSTFGNGVTYNDPRFFAEFARCIVQGKDIVLKSKGGAIRSYLDADDAAFAILYVLISGENRNAYNLTNMNNTISIRDIAKRMIDLSGTDVHLRFELTEDIEKMGYRKECCTLMDTSKVENLGWKPVYTLDETLTKLIDCIKREA